MHAALATNTVCTATPKHRPGPTHSHSRVAPSLRNILHPPPQLTCRAPSLSTPPHSRPPQCPPPHQSPCRLSFVRHGRCTGTAGREKAGGRRHACGTRAKTRRCAHRLAAAIISFVYPLVASKQAAQVMIVAQQGTARLMHGQNSDDQYLHTVLLHGGAPSRGVTRVLWPSRGHLPSPTYLGVSLGRLPEGGHRLQRLEWHVCWCGWVSCCPQRLRHPMHASLIHFRCY